MAGGKGNTTSANFLKLLYQAVAWADFAENDSSSPATQTYVALSTGTLTAASAQNTTEAAYTGYARVAVIRTSSGWAISSQTISNVASVTFPASTSGPETETYFSVGTASTGAGIVLHWAPISSPVAGLVVNPGITPSFAIGALTLTEA